LKESTDVAYASQPFA